MKRLFLFLLCFLPLTAWTQETEPIDPPEEEQLSHWDSIRIIDSDTVNSLPEIGILGDVLTGYSILGTVFGDDEINKQRVRLWQRDANGNPVRQLVVLKERWPNTPPDILFNPEAEAGGESGGYKLAAVTPAQYEALKRDSAIWGEAFQMFYPDGITEKNRDTVPNRPGYEISCVQLGCEWAPFIGIASRVYSREMMAFRDTLEDGTVLSYMCMAANITSCHADYTPGKTGYKYDTRWMLCDETESKYWMDKWKAAQEQQAEEDGYLRSYREWLLRMDNGQLGMDNEEAGNVSFFRNTSFPQERKTCPDPFWMDNDVGKLKGAIIGNVLSGYQTVALPFDGQSTRFRWFWTDSTKALGQQLIVLKLPSPYAPDSLLAGGGGLALASVDLDAYLWFKNRDLIWGECWEVTPVEGGFEFICLKAGAEWMAEDDPDYLRNSLELAFYPIEGKSGKVPIPTVGANRTKGAADYPPLYFPVRLVKTEAKTNSY